MQVNFFFCYITLQQMKGLRRNEDAITTKAGIKKIMKRNYII